MRKFNENEFYFSQGFSLIEVIVVISITSIGAMIIAQWMTNNQRMISNQDARISFMFPKLLMQQIVRENPDVICREIGFIPDPKESPTVSASYKPVPLENQLTATDDKSKEIVKGFFAPKPIPSGATNLGVIARSTPHQFISQLGFDSLEFDCESDVNHINLEICKSNLIFNTAAHNSFVGMLPPSDRFPIELTVEKTSRQLLSCKLFGMSQNDSPKEDSKFIGMMDVGGFYMDKVNHGPLSTTDQNPAREAHRYCNSQGKHLCEQHQMWLTCDNGMVAAPPQGFCISAGTANQARVREDDCRQKRLNSTGDCQGAYFRCCMNK